jgi:hypothetical protein
MKIFISAAALLLLVPSLASAQNADHVYHVEGYAFFAGEATVGPAGGAGGEGLFSNGFGLGGEYVKAESPFREQMVSANIYYHIGPIPKKRTFESFVTGGLTRFSVGNLGPYPAYGGNVGGGANIWLTKHAALRLEIRDTIGGRSVSIEYEPGGNDYTAPQNVVSFRIGVTFR